MKQVTLDVSSNQYTIIDNTFNLVKVYVANCFVSISHVLLLTNSVDLFDKKL
jgi:hypothetical protein